MKFTAFFKTVVLLLTIGFVVSCDKDFNEIGADLIDDIHYDFDKEEFSVLAYNVSTGPVQTSNLPINSLGYYKNDVFGATTASFLTQVELASTDPKFYGRYEADGITPDSDFKVDSVYIHVPYFSNLVSTDATTGDSTYSLDSIHGQGNELKLSVYRSQYFLLDLDPTTGLTEPQRFYSDQFNIMTSTVSNSNNLLGQNDTFKYSPSQIKFLKTDTSGNIITPNVVRERLAPGIYMDLDADKFKSAIFYAPDGKLVDNNVFKDYFKGIYFKAENVGQMNALARLNFAQGKITIVYKGKDSESATEYKRKTLVLNLAGNSVNLFDTNYVNPIAPNPVTGDQKLYLKGGQGSMAVIKLFGPDSDNDGVADELEDVRTKGWLVNEANLVFHIDKTTMSGVYGSVDANSSVEFEPNRILVYDLNNKRVLIDYSFDITTNTFYPKFNKFVHDGIIQIDADDDKGLKYKVRLTNHIRNLISKDSTNVNLGLVVTESINNVSNVKLKNSFTAFGTEVKYIPAMSVVSPLGTVLWGSNLPASDGKRLKLEIFYTKPD
jgi:Domain of unknown function (DUF4270)